MPPQSPPRPPSQRPPSAPPLGGKSIESIFVDIAIAAIIFLVILGVLGSFFGSVLGSYVNVIAWLYGSNWRIFYIIVTILMGLFDAILLVLAGFIIKRYNKLRAEIPPAEVMSQMISPQEEFQQNWQDIQSLMQSQNASDWNMAILRADAQLDEILDQLGYEGETIAERLKVVDPTKLKSMDRIWSSHRLRNTIAHDPLQQYTREMVTHALDSYQLAFQELGFLQEAEP